MRMTAALVLFLLCGGQLQAQYFSEELKEARRWDLPLQRSLRKVDYGPLRTELVRRQPGLDEAAARRLLERNLHFVVENRLNRQRMLVAPRAQDVVDDMARLLRLAHEISERVAAGRRMAVEHRLGERPALPLDLVREIGGLADDVQDGFSDVFVELRHSRVAVGRPASGAPYSCFIYFLLESERLQRRLEDTLESYFLQADPGVVEADDFRRGSVMALGKALEWLSDETYRNLKKKR